MLNDQNDTIVAQATPPGRGGIAVIRISGPETKELMLAVVGSELAPRKAALLPFRDESGEALDEGLAIFFPGPHSFTGEDVLELHGHGGSVVVDLILKRLLQLGARLARPGEFSERAFLNNKIDLTQAEAIADLIDASSKQAVRSAMHSLQGDFSKSIHALNEKIIHLRMYVEAAIDFTDEEIDFLQDETIKQQVNDILEPLDLILKNAKQGSLLREGVKAVIIGEPNVGKSSLLNNLSGKDVAIVTDIPGTTRDVLRDTILIDGMPMHIIDTAGLRESDDIVEQEGIRRAYQEIENANFILYVVDANKTISLHDHTRFKCPTIVIRNKIDLLNELPSMHVEDTAVFVSLSVKSGLGIDLLKQAIKSQVGFVGETEGVYLARRRHLDALKKAESHLKAGLNQLGAGQGELAADDLRLAHLALSEITGEFTADDLLGRIFSSFCIGK